MQTRELIFIGGGGHTRALLGVAQAAGMRVRGIITSNADFLGSDIYGVPFLGLEDDFALSPKDVTLVNGVGNLAKREGSGLAPRTVLYQRYRARGYDFSPFISPHALIGEHVTVGEGLQVMPGAVIQAGAMIGENVIINTRASIDHDAVIDAHCHIAPGAVLCGHVVVGEGTHIGAGAVITQGVRIGRHVVIGAGAVITRDVPDSFVVRPAMSDYSPLLTPPSA